MGKLLSLIYSIMAIYVMNQLIVQPFIREVADTTSLEDKMIILLSLITLVWVWMVLSWKYVYEPIWQRKTQTGKEKG